MTNLGMIKLHVKRNQARCGPLKVSECVYLIERLEKAEAENAEWKEAGALAAELANRVIAHDNFREKVNSELEALRGALEKIARQDNTDPTLSKHDLIQWARAALNKGGEGDGR